MKAFSINFIAEGKMHSAKVIKHNCIPVKYEVSRVMPYNRRLPVKFNFFSNPGNDQLICHSFNDNNRTILIAIGEAIFKACQMKRMEVHQ